MKGELLVFIILLFTLLAAFVRGHGFLVPVLLSLAFFGSLYMRGYQHHRRQDFINQLKSHRRELRAGGTVVVDGLLLRYDSVITSYKLSVGLLLTSINIYSDFRLSTGEEHPEAFIYSLLSLVSGWWAFPMGPIITLQFISSNLSGGEKTTVAMLIDRPLLEENCQKTSAATKTEKTP